MGSSPESIHSESQRQGRPSGDEWRLRVRHLLRHIDDPIELQRSPLSRGTVIEDIAKAKYPNGIVARGRALNDLIIESLQEIESELNNHGRVAKVKAFISMIREGRRVGEAARGIGVTPEYASRTLKRITVELLAEKLLQKLRRRRSHFSASCLPAYRNRVSK